MAERDATNVIRGQFDSTSALRMIESLAGGAPILLERGVLYPYIGFTARCNVSTMIGKKVLSFDCLVDAINGHGATADTFVADSIVETDELRLEAKLAYDDARQTARRTVTHRLGRKLRMIAAFDVQLDPAGMVYKRFWIIRVGDSRVMVDSVTGSIRALTAAAA